MAVRIFVEKENELLSACTKKHPKLRSSSTAETSLLQTPKAGKMLTMTPRLQQSARKALGDVNCLLHTGAKTDHSQKKGRQKVHKMQSNVQTFKMTKPTEKTSISEPPKCPGEQPDDYPEIETFIPFDPFDFEDFNVPEEHRLDHICLAGLPLLILEKEGVLMEKVLNKVPSPMKWPSLVKESSLMAFDNTEVLEDLDGIEVELPPMEYDF
ncbi:securin [Pristis pectinata]|uniref:securin n=1 Tax=Pristis pectinata TaxID=685728 RepID=UPI00223D1268|nr:securin [Pristis pectinata]XP_051870661.1 securin [Pristis pectinata]